MGGVATRSVKSGGEGGRGEESVHSREAQLLGRKRELEEGWRGEFRCKGGAAAGMMDGSGLGLAVEVSGS
jgi:hypothetical protein